MKQPRTNVVDRAIRAALALQARAGWITGAHFDEAKRTRLASLLKIPELKKAELIRKAESAVIVLAMADGKTEPERELADLVATARDLKKAWAAVQATAHIPFRDALRVKVPGEDFEARAERVKQVHRVMAEDIVYVQHTAEQMLAAIRGGGKVRRPAEYLCARSIALAWHEATGKAPTVTRNLAAVSGPQATAFQKFAREAAPSIGPATWRQVIEAVGDQISANQRAKSPKGE